jgi:hypothetical protein
VGAGDLGIGPGHFRQGRVQLLRVAVAVEGEVGRGCRLDQPEARQEKDKDGTQGFFRGHAMIPPHIHGYHDIRNFTSLGLFFSICPFMSCVFSRLFVKWRFFRLGNHSQVY